MLWALLVLKLQLARNQTRLSDALALALLGVAGVLWTGVSVGAGAFCYLASASAAPKDPNLLLLIFDVGVCGFLFLSLTGLVAQLQRAETVDFRKMMHFPVSLPGVFLLNYTASLFSSMLILFASVMSGLVAGLYVRYGIAVFWGAALAALFHGMLAACLYSFRGWMASLMVGKRRRAWIVSLATLVFVVLIQLPNFLFLAMRHEGLERLSGERTVDLLHKANVFFPPFWLSLGLWRLAQGEWRDAALCAGGMAALTLAALALGFRNTLRSYQGKFSGGSAPAPVIRNARLPWTLRRLPLCSEETASVAMAYFLTLVRHTQLRVALLMPFLFAGALAIMPRWLPKEASSFLLSDAFLAIMAFFILVGYLPYQSNLFGVDAGGFLRLTLWSAPRRRILLGLNLALSALVLATGLAMLAPVIIFTGLSVRRLLMALAGLVFTQMVFCMAGNLCSIYFPFRMDPEAMRRQMQHWTMMLRMLAGELLVGLALAPVAICCLLDVLAQAQWGPNAFPAGLAAELALIAAMGLLYLLTLSAMSDLLLSREQRILEALARKRE